MDLVQSLTHYNWFVVVLAVISAMMVFKFISELFTWFIEKFGLETRSMREKRENKELLKKTAENLNSLQERHTKDEKDFRAVLNKHISESEKDRKALHQVQKELVKSQSKISDSMQGLVEKFDEFKVNTDNRFDSNEEKENKRVRAELKNSISEIYRIHHATGQINDIELETLEDLIEEYEAAKGENSFVHSLVQKEMYTWEKVERN
jgi:hypothetical protein